jgi:signal transduction histidine kinase
LENALHHGGGTVVVRRRMTGTAPGGSVVVEVADEGPGVPAQLGQRVFERAVSGRSGTGLGLALARDLAESNGGRLDLVQAQPARFALFLSEAETD